MSHLSVRLPDEIEQRLDREAERTGRNRSDLVREAVGQYLTQKERDRMIEEMKQAARVLSSDPDAIRASRELAEEGLEDWIESIECEERAAGVDRDEKWWE
ncbi:ribbon-helix-helix protein, CopG family [Wenzhouxiangella sp. AB-CW3]|uniref:ribbon-helix-helix protein, CopG family n=1 Tax=Wenzhouxiangella sp. AB-CW3 TaxID=2771012 RepID=UPI00168AD4D7|nr:ribbon-helix-helix protein, CopG family [Wenzhouxiangella sp. AB-CW3]QOC21490.1 ribbon-helix-helix protein, CopG family [Wenzhouxiangella sp. AB-CW3]